MAGRFLTVACPSCEHEQVIFEKASTPVDCGACEERLATPTGGKADITGEVLEVVEAR